jgi:hypothetical protein
MKSRHYQKEQGKTQKAGNKAKSRSATLTRRAAHAETTEDRADQYPSRPSDYTSLATAKQIA